MNTPKFNLTLLLLGLAAFVATPSSSFAQEDKGGVESTQGVDTGEVQGTVEKINQDAGEAQGKAGKKGKKGLGGGKTTKEQRQLMHAVAAEMGKYRANTARLAQARSVGERKNNADLIKKANEMAPKLEAQHKEAMDALRAKYGEKEVAAVVERLNSQSKSDIKKHKKFAGDATKKGNKQAKETKGKGKKKQKHREGKEEGSDS
ncbi:MAG: hypothetical protein QM477_01165 [Planctomycetota bacterium]